MKVVGADACGQDAVNHCAAGGNAAIGVGRHAADAADNTAAAKWRSAGDILRGLCLQ